MHDTPDARRDTEGVDDDLLSRYLAGQCTATERARVREWLAGDPSRHTTLEAFTRALAEPESQMRAESALGAGWARVMAKIGVVEGPSWPVAGGADDLRADADRTENPAVVRPRPGARPRLWSLGVGGVHRRIAWVAGTTIIVLLPVTIVAAWRAAGSRVAPQQFREFASAPGGRATVVLRDGTRLLLGPATHVRVPADFGHVQRAVELDGEAIFAVSHDDHHPFAVHTARAVVRDVGTTFVIRAYASDSEERVGVVEGEVAIVRTPGRVSPEAADRRSLQARDVASVTDRHIVVTRGVTLTALTAWAQGRIVFDETPLSDVVRELSRVFDLSITVGDSVLAQDRVTAAYSDESSDQVLDDITSAIGARYERTGRTVVIRRRARGATHGSPALVVPLTTAVRSNPRG